MGQGTSFDKQNLITYTIGFKTEQDLLEDTAANGGGQYYVANNVSGLLCEVQKQGRDQESEKSCHEE